MAQANGFALPKPPENPRRGSPRPITDPVLVDQDPPDDTEDVERFETFESIALDELLTEGENARALEAALDDGRVRELMGGSRPSDVAAGLVLAKAPGEAELLRFRFFSCETLRSVDVILERASLQVLAVDPVEGQPAPTIEELERAVSLAAAALRVGEESGLVGRAIFVTRADPADMLFRHRLADVRFGKADERRPLLRALVDVCDGRVIDAGDFERRR